MTEALFSSCESCIVAALNLPEKNTQIHFSLYYNNNFGLLFEWSERNRLLAICCWKVI